MRPIEEQSDQVLTQEILALTANMRTLMLQLMHKAPRHVVAIDEEDPIRFRTAIARLWQNTWYNEGNTILGTRFTISLLPEDDSIKLYYEGNGWTIVFADRTEITIEFSIVEHITHFYAPPAQFAVINKSNQIISKTLPLATIKTWCEKVLHALQNLPPKPNQPNVIARKWIGITSTEKAFSDPLLLELVERIRSAACAAVSRKGNPNTEYDFSTYPAEAELEMYCHNGLIITRSTLGIANEHDDSWPTENSIAQITIQTADGTTLTIVYIDNHGQSPLKLINNTLLITRDGICTPLSGSMNANELKAKLAQIHALLPSK